MPGRSHQERLKFELDVIRRELIQQVNALQREELDWRPQSDMKSFRQLLLEVGATELISLRLMRDQELLPWEAAWEKIERNTEECASLLKALEAVRTDTLSYLAVCDEERLQTPIPLPVEWCGAFGDVKEIEREELFREIARHEYYHLGQIITYRWLQGHNPYKPERA